MKDKAVTCILKYSHGHRHSVMKNDMDQFHPDQWPPEQSHVVPKERTIADADGVKPASPLASRHDGRQARDRESEK